MPADPRADLALDAHLAYMRQLTTAGGGEVIERDGALALRSRHGMPFLVNAALRTHGEVQPAAVLDLAKEVFQRRGHEVLALGDRDEDVLDAAVAAGLKRAKIADPLQYIDRRPVPSPAERSTIEVRVIDDEAGAADIVEVTTDAHLVYDFPDDFFRVVLGPSETVLADNIVPFVVYGDEGPLATAQLIMHGEIGYVGWVAVVKEAMGRGLGWLVTERVVNEGLDRGAQGVALIASPMGAPLYRKMGFVDVGSLASAHFDPDAVRPETV